MSEYISVLAVSGESKIKQVIMVCAALFSLLIFAQDGHCNEVESQAREAFKEGNRLFDLGEYANAADQFRLANELNPNWKLLYNIGQSEAAAKRYGLAIEMFQAYLAHGGDALDTSRRDEILAEVQRLQMMVGYVEVQGGETGAMVMVDGVERGELPLSGTMALSSGVEHRIEIKKNEAIAYEGTLKLLTGQTTVLNLDASDKPVVEDGSTGSSLPPEEVRVMKVLGIVSLGVGGAALAGWGVVGGMALKLHGDLKNDCEESGCPISREDDQQKLDKLSTAATVMLAAGAGFVALGTILLIADRKKQKKQNESIVLTPVFSPRFAGAAVTGRF